MARSLRPSTPDWKRLSQKRSSIWSGQLSLGGHAEQKEEAGGHHAAEVSMTSRSSW